MLGKAARLAALHRLGALPAGTDPELDEVVGLVARIFDAPAAAVTLVDGDQQWQATPTGPDGSQPPRELAFCDHTLRHAGVLVVEDLATDPRFLHNPLVTDEPHLRFYAGAPLVTSDGGAFGTLCVVDAVARAASPYQQAMLVALADQVVRHLEERRADRAGAGATPAGGLDVALRAAHLRRLVTDGSTGYLETTDDGVIVLANAAAARMLGYQPDQLIGRSARDLAHSDHPFDTDAGPGILTSGGRRFHEVTRVYQHRTGRAVPVLSSVSVLAATATTPASVAALLVDLSPRVAADSHRLAAELDRDRVLQAATDAYIHIDPTGSVLEWNAAAERVFGYPARQAVGSELAELIIPAEQREAHRAGLRRVRAGGPSLLQGRTTEMIAQHQDGHQLHVELTPWSVTDGDLADGFHAFCRDIGDRVTLRSALLEANERLRRGQEQLQAAFEASPTADAVLDGSGRFVDVNAQLCRLLGQSREQLLSSRLEEVVFPPDRAQAAAALTAAGSGPLERTELRFVGAQGEVTWGLAWLAPLGGEADPSRSVLRIENVQAYKDLENALARQSTHDPVSGLPNRALFLERVRQAVSQVDDGLPVAVLVLRAEGLRDLIDEGGFGLGDDVLGVVAGRLAELTGADQTVACLRPGVFGAVVHGGGNEAGRLAGRYLESLRTPVELPHRSVTLRVSVGISTVLADGGDEVSRTGQLVQDAEDAARLARDGGGDAVVFAAPEMRLAQQRQGQLEALIARALADDRVDVAYQPVFDLSSGMIVAAEALLRLSDDGPVPPLEVVSAAEVSGQIVELGRRVLHLAAGQAAQWRRDHGFLVPVAVNVSAVQLRHAGFIHGVLDALDSAGVPAEALTLELTESVLLTSGSAGMRQLLVLRDVGVHLAIDDFGTGYASLTYLRDLPATTLKIDRSFVEGIPHDRGAMAIVRGVIDLARSFGMSCIAEGIENEAQREYLAGRGVLGQGFLLGRPTDGATVSRLIAHHGAEPARPAPETLSVADARDAAGARRDQAGHDRDEAGNARDHIGDLRDQVGDQRDLVADQRDAAGDQRDAAADERDDLAEARDRAGTRRDVAAGLRDLEAERADSAGTSSISARRQHLLLARRAARSDRERALQDREAGAGERLLAGRDRTIALADRDAGAHEREQAEVDRTTASDDRGLGAGERERSGDDRSTAQTDRGASARERVDSSLDGLTGAHVRGAGLLELQRDFNRSQRTGQSLVVAFLDVDKLKELNDAQGHAAGDALLRAVAVALRDQLRSYDLVIRYGGDEFLCALSGISLLDASARLGRANAALGAQPLPGSFSVGLAERQPEETLDGVIARADAALYRQRRKQPARSADL